MLKRLCNLSSSSVSLAPASSSATLVMSVRHASAPSGSASKDTSSMPHNWNMLTQSQLVAQELIERDSKSNTKDKIPDYTRKPQEQVPMSGKYTTVDPTIKQAHEAKIHDQQEKWKQSMKGKGSFPAPNPENSLDYGMRRRIRVIQENEKADAYRLGSAFELGNLALRK